MRLASSVPNAAAASKCWLLLARRTASCLRILLIELRIRHRLSAPFLFLYVIDKQWQYRRSLYTAYNYGRRIAGMLYSSSSLSLWLIAFPSCWCRCRLLSFCSSRAAAVAVGTPSSWLLGTVGLALQGWVMSQPDEHKGANYTADQ